MADTLDGRRNRSRAMSDTPQPGWVEMKCRTSISDCEMSSRWLGRSPRRRVAARKSYNPIAMRRTFSFVAASKSGVKPGFSAEEAETMVYLPFSGPGAAAGMLRGPE